VAQASSEPSGRTYPPPAGAEAFWPVQATVLTAIGLQVALSKRLTVGPAWLVPALEAVLLIGLSMATPRQLEHEHRGRRLTAISLTAFVSAANVFSLVELTHLLLHHVVSNGSELIVSGMLIWLTNFLIFALWYWEMDRAVARRVTTDRRTSSSHRCQTTASSRATGDRSSSTTCTYR